jgi:acetyl esterase/lipase
VDETTKTAAPGAGTQATDRPADTGAATDTDRPADADLVGYDVAWQGDLLARVYEPPAAAGPARAVVIDVHGGAWNAQDRTLGARYCRAAAAAGFVVAAIDFRDGRVARHPAGADDVRAGVDWARSQAAAWGVEPGADGTGVALVGSSSGGHLALQAALGGAAVAFVGAFWPPVDPLARYRYARSRIGQPVPDGQRFDAANLVRSTEAYFGDEATMAEASIAAIVRDGRAQHLPPVWLVQAGEDLNVPAAMIDELVEAYRSAGGALELSVYPGEVHGFGHGRHDAARRFQAHLVERLERVFPAAG